jgi:outer membrane receptor protein involved in Fe transport
MKSTMKSDQKFYCTVSYMVMVFGTLASEPLLGQTNAPTSTNVTTLNTVTVVGHLNEARSQIVPNLGATAYSFNTQSIVDMSQGDNAGFNEVILRAPGVAEDSLGQLHIRGEHANLQYRINDVVLPEGITGFGQELDPRFVQSMQVITGSLPAEYGFRTAGIIDIQTKGGIFTNGGSVELYGGSYDTIRPSFEYSGSEGKWSYFIDGSYTHDDIGIENPSPSSVPIHDYTDQYRTFLYASYLIDASSRLVLMGSADYSTFEIPINPNLQPISTQPNGSTWTATSYVPTDLNDNQTEQNYYGVAAYQKSAGDLNYQVSAFGRNSGAHYTPDALEPTAYFNGGVATDEKRVLTSGGVQADGSYALGDNHTLRGGLEIVEEAVTADTTTTVFPVDGSGNVDGSQEAIVQDNLTHALFAGIYLQDEWKIVPQLTLNFGTRFDVYNSTVDDENQVSPRANLIYQPTDSTTLHLGYSRYFTPPPLETVPASDLVAFNGTSGASGVTTATPVKAERANYYDVGASQKLLPGLTVGLDGYYKTAQEQLDDGFFGQSLILSSFNYTQGRVEGLELTVSYATNGFSSYANVALSSAQGKGAASAQFLWPDPTTVNYVNNHWIYLDHDQRVTGSFGAAYAWNEGVRQSTRVYVDALYGSGLRQDGPGTVGPGFGPATTDPIPNGSSVGVYYTLNLGVEQSFKVGGRRVLKARVDIVNVTDNIYPLRTGTGVGVNAAQYGERRGLFGSLSYAF